jgi:hypothetical protein
MSAGALHAERQANDASKPEKVSTGHVPSYAATVLALNAEPLWPTELTAWGTLAVAVAAVAVALFAEWRASIRAAAARKHSDKQLADERAAADERLRRQLEHSAVQLQAERDQVREREQQANAWAVRVELAEYDAGPRSSAMAGQPDDAAKQVMAVVTNNGTYPITEVSTQFSPDGSSLVGYWRAEHGGFPPTNGLVATGMPAVVGYAGVLTSGNSMCFASDAIATVHLNSPHAVVRWRDYWHQRWEYKKANVRKVGDGEPWLP